MAVAPFTPRTVIPRHQQPIPLLFFGGGDETLDDGSRYNPAVISFIRDEWLHKQVQEREPEFTEYRALRLFVGSWNVNGKMPKEDLTAWLCDGAAADAEGKLDLPDVYVIGLQEMVDLTVTNVALGAQSKKASQQWQQMLEAVLNDAARGPDSRYVQLATRYLVGVNIAVFCRASLAGQVAEVQDAEAPVGVMGVMGNKGGVSVRLRVADTTFCFVCAHLAAHRNAVAQRNADFASIMAKTEFRDEARAEAAAAAAGARGVSLPDIGRFGVLDHDLAIWFGDFNYRIVEAVSTEKCFELACGGDADLEQLRARDQLNLERAAQRSFYGFTEGPLTFRPTYKFQPGTSLYEQRPDKKLRAPAWCDRILWRTAPGVDPRHLRLLYYGSVDALQTSDHKPVHALFEMAVKTVVADRREAVVADITRQLDAMENRSMPKVNVSDTVIHVPDVVYALPVTRTVTIENVGDVAATWRFVPKPEEKLFCKTWLTVEPAYGMIPPGGVSTVSLTIAVDDAVARDISLGRELAFPALVGAAPSSSPSSSAAPTAAGGGGGGLAVTPAALGGLLDDILILRMERGRDYYLSVSATVLPTCFGCSLAQLARRPEPMRALSITALATAAVNAAAGITLGSSPSASGAGAGAGGGGGRPITAAPDLSAGSHALSSALAADDSDIPAAAGTGGRGGLDLDGAGGRAVAAASAAGGGGDHSRKGSHLLSVPKEIWRLVDALWSRGGLAARGLFAAPGSAADVVELRECLDTGDAIPAAADPLAVAQVLCDLLESLREPVVPCALFPGADFRALPLEAWTAHLLKQLSPLHYNTLVYVVRFGREVAAQGAANGCSVDALATVLSRCMMRHVPHDEAAAHAPLDGGAGAAAAAAADGGGAGSGRSGAAASAAAVGEDEEGGAALSRLALHADKGTRWEPSREEQESMSRIFAYLLTSAPLA